MYAEPDVPPGSFALRASLQGTIVAVRVKAGDRVHAGQTLLVVEAMKLEHEIATADSGIVRELLVAEGDLIEQDQPLIVIE